MNHEIMTIEEVAAYLRVSERTVYDWAHKGQLPGGKIGTTWRFKRRDIENWVNRHLGTAVPSKPPQSAAALPNILTPDRVVFFDYTEKKEALQTLCAVLAGTAAVHHAEELEQGIFRREELMSTGIGFGVGVPHVRLQTVDELVMALGIAREPLQDYDSLDGQPVQIVCMLAAGSGQHPQYIRALSAISARLRQETLRRALINAPHAAEAYRLFTGEEG